MSEYWKSTPKYWCKFCKEFIKDTKLERQQHDAKIRHQNNIQRSLRNLHREKEHEDRQKQRAKDEVARLNGVVGASTSSASIAASKSSSSSGGGGGGGGGESNKKATLEERKRQMAQLAAMGIEIPEEFRREMGMTGGWQTIQVTQVERQPEHADPDSKEAAAYGIRKRKFEDQEEEDAILGTGDAASARPRNNRAWGARMKTFPGKRDGLDEEMDVLLGGIVVKKRMAIGSDGADVEKGEATTPLVSSENAPVAGEDVRVDDENRIVTPQLLKKSESQEQLDAAETFRTLPTDPSIKTEDAAAEERPAVPAAPGAGIVFKKRKKIVR